MTRTTRKQIEDLAGRLAQATGLPIELDYYQPGGNPNTWRVGPFDAAGPFGDRRRTAGETADVLRFALSVVGAMQAREEA